jgi:hypothetical protein
VEKLSIAMKVTSAVDSLESLPSLREHILRSGILLFVAGLLLLLLSGGIPPAPWLLLIQAAIQFGAPWGQQGSALRGFYILLIAESLALGVAWFLFVWAIVHETRHILNIRARLQQTVPITVSRGISPSNTSSPSSTSARRLNARRRDEQDFSRESPGVAGTIQTGKFPENPFEEPGIGPHDRHVGPVVRNSPFDIQNDVYSVFRRSYPYNSILDVSEEKIDREENSAKEEESPFRYGNPFEGSLPEVFSYDVDLRRSILEVEAEVTQLEIDTPQKDQLEAKANSKGSQARP